MNTSLILFLNFSLDQKTKQKKNDTKKRKRKKNKKFKKLPQIYINLINKGLWSETLIFLEKKLKTDLPRLFYWKNLERSLWMKVMKVILLPKLMKTPLGYIKFDPKLEWVVKIFWTIFFQFYKRDKSQVLIVTVKLE